RLEAKGYNEDNSEMENVNNNPSLIGININITEEGVLLSKEDFKLLIETADICLTVQNDSRKS
ncbi:15036_t:CDS:2, partial [Entrophospora sp. SA101]